MAVVALLAGSAAADPYPQLVVDRPLVYSPGMTAADVGIDAPSYRYGYSSNTRLGDYIYPDLGVKHAFGGLQLGADFGETIVGPILEVAAQGYVGPGRLTLELGDLLPKNGTNIDSELRQYVGYVLKATVVPHALSVDGGAGFTLYELQYQYAGSSSPMFAGASAGATLQLVPELSVGAHGGFFVPLADTSQVHTSAWVGGNLTYVVDRFDVYAWARLDELQRAPLPSVGGGVTVRLGG
ncbi:MAG TPA: hypothetical protein VLT45_17160 [Kofleriaceae bacterium]|nr:hypothetical protein [Kofleriaceae bacterium]